MSMEEAIEYALSGEETSSAPPAPARPRPSSNHRAHPPRRGGRGPGGARGLTNRQIASELSISEHTVANHVAKILTQAKSKLPLSDHCLGSRTANASVRQLPGAVAPW